jgi:hypothetical protein
MGKPLRVTQNEVEEISRDERDGSQKVPSSLLPEPSLREGGGDIPMIL